jgi:hypothetical protein
MIQQELERTGRCRALDEKKKKIHTRRAFNEVIVTFLPSENDERETDI